MKLLSLCFTVCVPAMLVPCLATNAQGQSQGQIVKVSTPLQIPEATLPPGQFTLSVEDRMADRAIVRIEEANTSKHYLILAVPSNTQFEADANGLSYFTSTTDGTRSLRAWKCSNCASALEFVYPKLEAVKITDSSAQPVLAVDPEYDKLPPNLSEDDMKVVTLWLLSPERISNNVGEGVKAAKYQAPASDSSSAAAQTPAASQATPAETAANTAPAGTSDTSASSPATVRHGRLPKTASNTFSFLGYGLLLLGAATGLRIRRIKRS